MLWKHTGKLFWPHYLRFSWIPFTCRNNRNKIKSFQQRAAPELRSVTYILLLTVFHSALGVEHHLQAVGDAAFGLCLGSSPRVQFRPWILSLFLTCGTLFLSLTQMIFFKKWARWEISQFFFNATEMKSFMGWTTMAPFSDAWEITKGLSSQGLWNSI